MRLPLICFLSLLLIETCFAQEPKLILSTGHTERINAAAFSPDGKHITTVSEDHTIKIWDLKSGFLVADLQAPDGEPKKILYSPDGTYFVILCKGKIDIWDAATAEFVRQLSTPDSLDIYNIRFGANSKNLLLTHLVGASQFLVYEPTQLWNIETGAMIHDFKGASSSPGSISPDGKLHANCVEDDKINIWSLETGELIAEIEENANTVCFSSDGKSLISYNFTDIKIWDLKENSLLHSFALGELNVYMSLSPGKKFMAGGSAGYDKPVLIWDVESEKKIYEIKGLPGAVDSVVFNSEETILMVFTNKEISAWNTQTWKKIYSIIKPDGTEAVYLSPDKKRIILAGKKGEVRNAENGILLTQLAKGFDYPYSLSCAAYDNINSKVVSAFVDGFLLLWDINTGKNDYPLTGATGGIYNITQSPDANYIIPLTGSNKVTVLNTTTGRIAFKLNHIETVLNTKYSNDGKFIVSQSWDSTIKVWDALKAELKFSYKTKAGIKDVIFSSINKEIIIAEEHLISVFDFITNKKKIQYPFSDRTIEGIIINSDDTKIAVFTRDNKSALFPPKNIIVINTKTGARLFSRNGHKELGISMANFSPNGQKLLLAKNSNAEILDATTGKVLVPFELSEGITTAYFSTDGEKIITSAFYGGTIKVWSSQNGKLINELKGGTNVIYSPRFDSKGTNLLAISDNAVVHTWNASSGNPICEYNEKAGKVDYAHFYDNDNRIMVMAGNNSLSFWKTDSCKKAFSLHALNQQDFLFKTPDNYYMCPPGAAKVLYYASKDLKVITFEQLDVKYNRPDKVMEATGCSDTLLIESYRKAYYKRLKKLGIDTTSFKTGFTIPEADFENRNTTSYEQKNKQLTLQITGSSTENLDRINVWINEVPLYGQKGINLRLKNKKIMETSITDVNGIESYRQPLFVKYVSQKPTTAKTYFIGLGINRFSDSIHNLNWSVKDIRDLANKFASKGAVIDTLFDEGVTIENVLQLKKKLLLTGEEDKVIIAYSGHGLLSSDYDYFLSTYAVNFNQPQISGLPYEELENLLDGIKARKKLLLIDACHSGEVDKEEMKNYSVAKDSLEKNGVKGFIITQTDNNKIGMKNSFEMMQELFVNVGRGTGTTVISAAAGTQFALERGDLKNGVFTYCLLDAMRGKNTLKISDLKKVVTEKVPQLTNGLQKPTFRSETQQYDWELW